MDDIRDRSWLPRNLHQIIPFSNELRHAKSRKKDTRVTPRQEIMPRNLLPATRNDARTIIASLVTVVNLFRLNNFHYIASISRPLSSQGSLVLSLKAPAIHDTASRVLPDSLVKSHQLSAFFVDSWVRKGGDKISRRKVDRGTTRGMVCRTLVCSLSRVLSFRFYEAKILVARDSAFATPNVTEILSRADT